ncbi:hypothetical protein C8J57DRAFT_1722528 [Mycena rebaudengoi]|nr:hypothetical protein C8J57DRAFT_1722528 [Mycena rebaudengoi]
MVNSTGRKLQKVDVTSFATRQRRDVPESLRIVHSSSWRQHRLGLHTSSACSGRGGPRRLAVRYRLRRIPRNTTATDALTTGYEGPHTCRAIRLRRMSLDADYADLAPIHPPLHDPRTTPSENACHRPSGSAISITVEQQEQREQQRVEQARKRDTTPPSTVGKSQSPAVDGGKNAMSAGSGSSARRPPSQGVEARPAQPAVDGSAWAVQWQQARIAPLEPAA